MCWNSLLLLSIKMHVDLHATCTEVERLEVAPRSNLAACEVPRRA